MVELWVGPAIVAAAVSALVTAAGWFVGSWQAQRVEQRRRDEKVNDFQIALRAEIASDLLNLIVVDRAAYFESIKDRYDADPLFSVVVPHMPSNTIFNSISREIHILPGEVIAPVVEYERLREVVERFVSDLRSDRFSSLARERQLLMYSDYLDMLGRLEAIAQRAVDAIGASLETSNPAAVRSTQSSGAAPAAVSAEERGEP